VTERDFLGLFDQRVSPFDTPSARDKPRSFECEENLLQKLDRDVLAIRNFMAL
jgi:hypothetical protein